MKLKMSKLSPMMVVLLLMALVLSACGGSTPTNTPSSSTGATTPEASAPTATAGSSSGPVTLRLTTWGSPAEQKAWEQQAAAFQAKSNGQIKVQVQGIPSDYDTKLTTMIAAHQEPDVAEMESGSIAFPLAEQGHFVNLKQFVDKDTELSLDQLVPNITYYQDPDTLIGIAPGPETFVLYYNEEMLKAAGVEPPPAKGTAAWTWDQFVDAAKKLTIDDKGRNAADPAFDSAHTKQFGISFGTWWGVYSNFIFSNGGDFISADGKTFALNQPEATEAIQKMADLINVHHVAPNAVQGKGLPGFDIALQTKKIAMVIDGQWANQNIALAKVPYNVAALPVLKTPVTTVVCGMFSIFSSSKNPEQSWQLVKGLMDPSAALDLYKTGLLMPAPKSWYTDPALLKQWTEDPSRPSGYSDAVIDMLLNHSHATPTGYVKNFSKIMDVVNPALDKVWSGQMSAQAAMDSIATKAQAQVQGRRDVK